MENATSALTVPAARQHHEFGPSRMEYLDTCAAFQNRQTTTEASKEGDLLHDLMSAMIKQLRPFYKDGQYSTTLEQLTDWVVPNNELTDDQTFWLRFTCKEVDKLLLHRPVDVFSEIEIRVTDDSGEEFNHGFLDVVFIYANETAIVMDFKFGYIPVPHAKVNLQGMNYVLGVFQKFPEVKRIGLKFVQPKLGDVTQAVYERAQFYNYLSRLKLVVDRAKDVQQHPETAQNYMKPGPHCEYCANHSSCAVLANHRAAFAAQFGPLPAPVPIANLHIEKLEDWALARYWVDVIETGLEDFKSRAQQVAEQNGGELRCTLPTGEEIIYEMRTRSTGRVLGDALSVADALKETMTLEEILGAAELSVTRLEKVVKKTVPATYALAHPGEKKMTQKAAWEQAEAVLSAYGLLSRPDTKIKFLQLKKQQKRLAETSAEGSQA